MNGKHKRLRGVVDDGGEAVVVDVQEALSLRLVVEGLGATCTRPLGVLARARNSSIRAGRRVLPLRNQHESRLPTHPDPSQICSLSLPR